MKNPITTAELFRLLSLSIGKEKPASAYAVAKAIGSTQSAAKNWELGHRVMDEAYAEKAADMLGLPLDFVILSLQAERLGKSNMDKIAAIFARAAEQASRHAASIFLVVFAVSALLSQAVAGGPLCILCKTRWFLFNASRSARHRPRSPLFA